eukprot:scaffold537_cov180-Ochromonas_danica.AAC.47
MAAIDDRTQALRESLTAFKAVIAHEEDYLIPSAERSASLLLLLKALYDSSSSSSLRPYGPLTSLVVEGQDEETIWEEVQTRLRPLLNFCERKTRRLLQRATPPPPPPATTTSGLDESEEEEEEEVEEEEDEEEKTSQDALSEEEEEETPSVEEEEMEQEEEEQEEEEEEGYGSAEDERMEAWLDDFEALEERHRRKAERREKRLLPNAEPRDDYNEEDDDEEDDLSFVQHAMYDSEMEEEEEEEKGQQEEEEEEIRYEDFFVNDKTKSMKKNKQQQQKQKKQQHYQEDDDDEQEEEEEGSEEEEEEEESASESEEEEAEEFERELMAGKSWELRGEVRASDRPENSLLTIVADVDRASKPAPIITQDYTNSLEDLITRRIQSETFDDPQPRSQPSTSIVDDLEGKVGGGAGGGGEDLSQEKDKKGLGDLYAEDYARQVLKEDSETSPQVTAARLEVLELFNKLSRTLDRLSHFYYTPKPVSVEVNAQVLANQRLLPALQMEDSAQGSAMINLQTSPTALAYAPEEIVDRPRNKIALLKMTAEEMDTPEVKQRRRRALKTMIRKQNKQNEAEKKRNQSADYLNKMLNDELRRDKRVTLAGEANGKKRGRGGGGGEVAGAVTDSRSHNKSAAFFGKLQAETEEVVRKKMKNSRVEGGGGGGEEVAAGRQSRSAAFKL